MRASHLSDDRERDEARADSRLLEEQGVIHAHRHIPAVKGAEPMITVASPASEFRCNRILHTKTP